MSNTEIKLSIIMPVFNEEKYISIALESVLFQKTNFKFEIIIVDDASTDKTVQIIKTYQQKFDNITLLINETNRGKGYGFMRAYESAQGEYFHVLDGDDYFISYNKIQKQVDFLDNNDEYVAVTHNSIILYPDQRISFVSNRLESRSFNYHECIKNDFYFHTSAFMYRKISKKLPDYFLEKALRGDSAVFFYHVYHSKKKVMYAPDIHSVYNYHGKGLWSALSNVERQNMIKSLFRAYLDFIITDQSSVEYKFIQNKLTLLECSKQIKNKTESSQTHLNNVLEYCHNNLIEFYKEPLYSKTFSGTHTHKLFDQLCESIGRILVNKHRYFQLNRIYDNNRIVLLVSGFNPNGGGVFREIFELINIYIERGISVSILSSNSIHTDHKIIESYFSHPNIEYWEVNANASFLKRTESIINKIHSLSPSKIYPFISLHDVAICASVQKGLTETIILDYVFDHGLSFGLTNSSIDKYILKTENQINSLAKTIPIKSILYVPPFLTDKYNSNPYKPLKNGTVTTATAAARAYKVESPYKYEYAKIIAVIMKITNGKHYHYGELNDSTLTNIYNQLDKLQISKTNFIHIQWEDDLSKSLIHNGVDLFISPFPVCSARIAIEVMSAGIPIINHQSTEYAIPQGRDFCDPLQPTWSTPEDLYNILKQIDSDQLTALSLSARNFYLLNNEYNLVKNRIFNEIGVNYTLNTSKNVSIIDISDTNFYTLDHECLSHLVINNDLQQLSLSNAYRNPLEFINQCRVKLKIRTRIRQCLKLLNVM